MKQNKSPTSRNVKLYKNVNANNNVEKNNNVYLYNEQTYDNGITDAIVVDKRQQQGKKQEEEEENSLLSISKKKNSSTTIVDANTNEKNILKMWNHIYYTGRANFLWDILNRLVRLTNEQRYKLFESINIVMDDDNDDNNNKIKHKKGKLFKTIFSTYPYYLPDILIDVLQYTTPKLPSIGKNINISFQYIAFMLNDIGMLYHSTHNDYPVNFEKQLNYYMKNFTKTEYNNNPNFRAQYIIMVTLNTHNLTIFNRFYNPKKLYKSEDYIPLDKKYRWNGRSDEDTEIYILHSNVENKVRSTETQQSFWSEIPIKELENIIPKRKLRNPPFEFDNNNNNEDVNIEQEQQEQQREEIIQKKKVFSKKKTNAVFFSNEKQQHKSYVDKKIISQTQTNEEEEFDDYDSAIEQQDDSNDDLSLTKEIEFLREQNNKKAKKLGITNEEYNTYLKMAPRLTVFTDVNEEMRFVNKMIQLDEQRNKRNKQKHSPKMRKVKIVIRNKNGQEENEYFEAQQQQQQESNSDENNDDDDDNDDYGTNDIKEPTLIEETQMFDQQQNILNNLINPVVANNSFKKKNKYI